MLPDEPISLLLSDGGTLGAIVVLEAVAIVALYLRGNKVSDQRVEDAHRLVEQSHVALTEASRAVAMLATKIESMTRG